MKRPKQLSPAALDRLVDDWNSRHRIGDPVVVTKDDGSKVETVATTAAYVMGGHTAVIHLEGIRGCYALERVKAAQDSSA